MHAHSLKLILLYKVQISIITIIFLPLSGVYILLYKMEELCLPVEEIQAWTRDLYLFLNNHRDITSAHSVDFFTCNHWENIIKSSWREDLLTMSCDEQLIKPSTGGPPGITSFTLKSMQVPVVYTFLSFSCLPRAPIMELRNLFNENFIDCYPRNLSPIRYSGKLWRGFNLAIWRIR